MGLVIKTTIVFMKVVRVLMKYILKYLAISIPFIVITQITTSVLQGIGSYSLPVINLLIACVIKVILTLNLVSNPSLNIYGAVIATVVSYILVSILNVICMKIKLNIKLKIYSSLIKPMYSAWIMMIVALFAYNNIYRKIGINGISCLLSISIGAIIYLVAILVLKVFSIEELRDRIKIRNKWYIVRIGA